MSFVYAIAVFVIEKFDVRLSKLEVVWFPATLACVTSACTVNFRASERQVKSLMIGVAEEVSDRAKTIVEISAAERVIITRS